MFVLVGIVTDEVRQVSRSAGGSRHADDDCCLVGDALANNWHMEKYGKHRHRFREGSDGQL